MNVLYEVIIGITQEPLWEFGGIVWEKEKMKKSLGRGDFMRARLQFNYEKKHT